MDYLVCTLIVGVGATTTMDAWGFARKGLLGIPRPNYGLVGRWLAWMTRGRFRHKSITMAPAISHERLIGWVSHYLIGIAFAGLLLSAYGITWVLAPTILPALLIGIGTVAAPFLLMQPGVGAGIAACLTPRPAAARVQSLVTHSVFGLGLYVAGWIAQLLK